MYATATSLNGVSGFDVSAIANINTAMTIPVLQIPGFEYQFTVTASTNVPQLENYLRGQYIDFVEVVEVSVTGLVYKIYTEQPINSNIYGDIGIKFSYIVNPNGWYSYKIVVKQNEQEYYNVYLPGIIKGYPDQTSVTPVTL